MTQKERIAQLEKEVEAANKRADRALDLADALKDIVKDREVQKEYIPYPVYPYQPYQHYYPTWWQNPVYYGTYGVTPVTEESHTYIMNESSYGSYNHVIEDHNSTMLELPMITS